MKKQPQRKNIIFILAIIVALCLSLDDIKDYCMDTKINSNPVECQAKIIRIEKKIALVRKEGYGKAQVYDVVGYKIIYQFKVQGRIYADSFDIEKNQRDNYQIENVIDVTYYKNDPNVNSMTCLVDKNKNIIDIFCFFTYRFIASLFFISIIFFAANKKRADRDGYIDDEYN